MFRSRVALVVVVGIASAGGGAAYAATHGPSHTVKPAVAKRRSAPPNVHYPCRLHGERTSIALQL